MSRFIVVAFVVALFGFVTVSKTSAYVLYPLHWPIATSPPYTVVKIRLGNSLANLPNINLKPIVRDTITAYNGLAAYNPWLDEVTTAGNEDILVKAEQLADRQTYAETQYVDWDYGTSEIIYEIIRFNTDIEWTTTYGGYCYDPPGPIDVQCVIDARKVSNHEMGHAQGLSHAPASGPAAIMKTGPLNYWNVQLDDVQGLQDRYGVYP